MRGGRPFCWGVNFKILIVSGGSFSEFLDLALYQCNALQVFGNYSFIALLQNTVILRQNAANSRGIVAHPVL